MIQNTISLIQPLDAAAMDKCQIRLDNLTKPLGSLHAFEHLVRQFSGITRNPRPRSLKKAILIMAGDHSAEEDPSASAPTRQRVQRFSEGRTPVNCFANHIAAALQLIDLGIAEDLPPLPLVRNEKIAYGTQNITKGPAMTRQQAIRAIEIGIAAAAEMIEKGYNVFGLGTMSNGNILSSTAVVACFSKTSPHQIVTKANGFSCDQIARLEQALKKNTADILDPIDVVSKLGSFEMAGLTGIILGAAAGRAAVVLDGLATAAAALLAVKLAPRSKDYLIGSHYPPAPIHKIALDLLAVPAHLHLNISSDEGLGAILGISLLNASLHVLNDMKTFGDAEVAVAQDGPGVLKQNKNVKEKFEKDDGC